MSLNNSHVNTTPSLYTDQIGLNVYKILRVQPQSVIAYSFYFTYSCDPSLRKTFPKHSRLTVFTFNIKKVKTNM